MAVAIAEKGGVGVYAFIPIPDGDEINLRDGITTAEIRSGKNPYHCFSRNFLNLILGIPGLYRERCLTYSPRKKEMDGKQPLVLFSPTEVVSTEELGESSSKPEETQDTYSSGLIHFPKLKTSMPMVDLGFESNKFVMHIISGESQFQVGIKELGSESPFEMIEGEHFIRVSEHRDILLRLNSFPPLCLVRLGAYAGRPQVAIGIDPNVYDLIQNRHTASIGSF